MADAQRNSQGDIRHAMPPLVQAYFNDFLLIAHMLLQFLEYVAEIAYYLADMGMPLNVRKCAYATTARISSIIVHLDPDDAVAPWVCVVAKACVLYLGLRLDPTGMASMKEKLVLRYEALLGWYKNTLGRALVPQEVMAVVIGSVVRYAAPSLSHAAAQVVRLNGAIKNSALQFENLPQNLSNVVVRSGKGLKLADV